MEPQTVYRQRASLEEIRLGTGEFIASRRDPQKNAAISWLSQISIYFDENHNVIRKFWMLPRWKKKLDDQ